MLRCMHINIQIDTNNNSNNNDDDESNHNNNYSKQQQKTSIQQQQQQYLINYHTNFSFVTSFDWMYQKDKYQITFLFNITVLKIISFTKLFFHIHTSFMKPLATRITFTSRTGSHETYGPSFRSIGITLLGSWLYCRHGCG